MMSEPFMAHHGSQWRVLGTDKSGQPHSSAAMSAVRSPRFGDVITVIVVPVDGVSCLARPEGLRIARHS